ncbi:hypothetical protein Zmor_009876 [Zophobas morio]|uniref:Transmembrane protein n=1 Tax=Zophobas morio TaxID=2755281 RepID=A0AA38MJ93_9CUCU|nr:hypothetical protein Zmor_009876 [Zophobas morio]
MYGNGNCTLTVSYHRGVVSSPHRNYANPHRVCVTIAWPSSKFTNICGSAEGVQRQRDEVVWVSRPTLLIQRPCCILLAFFAVFALRGATIWLPIGAITHWYSAAGAAVDGEKSGFRVPIKRFLL